MLVDKTEKVEAKDAQVQKKVSVTNLAVNKVIVHPLVLLSVVDHFNRMGKIVVIDAKPKDLGLPTEAYYSVEEVHDDGTPTSKTFEHVLSEIGAEEAEEVGVEHLLRDIKDTTLEKKENTKDQKKESSADKVKTDANKEKEVTDADSKKK
ncbi:hypothetical protein RND71_043899 [Anisodus tanguticus]|uniref:Uncharacterized protein n=1 Tax=Anisodus tanguticus TaxID=243964 RepID=A0AAE1QNU4_9SOLA|nr:hypothetical protein RND71_043899 [Anisodus tanguticus]